MPKGIYKLLLEETLLLTSWRTISERHEHGCNRQLVERILTTGYRFL